MSNYYREVDQIGEGSDGGKKPKSNGKGAKRKKGGKKAMKPKSKRY